MRSKSYSIKNKTHLCEMGFEGVRFLTTTTKLRKSQKNHNMSLFLPESFAALFIIQDLLYFCHVVFLGFTFLRPNFFGENNESRKYST